MTDHVLVCRPRLPDADRLLPYLRLIDGTRWYTNFGPLARRFETRLAALIGTPAHAVRSASSGTAALELAIMATAGPAREARPYALVPSLTFAATALAAERMGYRPWIVDVDPESWALDPNALADHPALDRTGVIVPVAACGRAPDMAALERLARATGVPVVLDAAAAAEAFLSGDAHVSATVPAVLSLHATKAFSTGEGGAVLWDDPDGQERVTRAANFGFDGGREATAPGTNAKLSEYHAAVGLAMLDGLEARQSEIAAVVRAYERAARDLPQAWRLHLPPDVGSAYVICETDGPEASQALEGALRAGRIETRRWYEAGLGAQPHFARCPRDPLPASEDIAARLIGLPMAPDLDSGAIARIGRVAGAAMAGSSAR
ncbi:MAG: DegT/DnrJ/EryC1/StrS family aminotransferase [Pseudomonadota bacterium]